MNFFGTIQLFHKYGEKNMLAWLFFNRDSDYLNEHK